MSCTYAVVDITDMTGTPARWDDVVESLATAIQDKEDTPTKLIIKWEGSDPSWFAGLSVPSYSTPALLHAALVTQDIWTSPEE